MYGIVDWSKNKDLKSIVLSLLGFIGATFHGATFLGAMIFIGVVTAIVLNDFIKSLKSYRVNIFNVILLSILSYVLFFILQTKLVFHI